MRRRHEAGQPVRPKLGAVALPAIDYRDPKN